MSSSALEYPQLAHQVNQLDLERLLEDAAKLSASFQPLVVFISSSESVKRIEKKANLPGFFCRSIHDFLKMGLHHNAFVIVVDKDRAECSSTHLKELLSSRTKHPFEIVNHSQESESELLEIIKLASRKVQDLISLENSINQTAQKLMSENSRVSNPSEEKKPLSSTIKLDASRNLLRARLSDFMESKPEIFLKEAISQIRKTSE